MNSENSRGSLAILATKGYLLISTVRERSDGRDYSRGPEAAAGRLSDLRCGGAMAGEAELAGARCLADSEHHCLKEKHREMEKNVASSPRRFFKPKRSRRGTSQRRLCSQLGEIRLELQQVLGLSYCGKNGRRTRGVGARAL